MLHGDIRINGTVIGEWRAERKERTGLTGTAEHNQHRYECRVAYNRLDGYNVIAEFDVHHIYTHGALSLASKILAAAPEHARPYDREQRDTDWHDNGWQVLGQRHLEELYK